MLRSEGTSSLDFCLGAGIVAVVREGFDGGTEDIDDVEVVKKEWGREQQKKGRVQLFIIPSFLWGYTG